MSKIVPEKKRIAELSIASASDIPDIDKCNRTMLKENYERPFYDAIFKSQLSCSFVLRVEKKKEASQETPEAAAPAVTSEPEVKVSKEPLKDAQLAGYVLASMNCDNKGRANCHIISLAVYNEFQRQGFARVLMQSVEAIVKERFPETHHLVLHVRKHNKAAYSLYSKLQYNRTKVVKAYYTTPKEDAYEMKKYLEPVQRPPQMEPQQEETSEKQETSAQQVEAPSP